METGLRQHSPSMGSSARLGPLLGRMLHSKASRPYRRRSTLGKASILLDTNVFLHYQLFTEIDWPDEIGSDVDRFLVSMNVVHELDHKKNHPDKNISQKAKRVIKKLWQAIENETIRCGGTQLTVAVLSQVPESSWMTQRGLAEASSDDRILAEALLHQESAGSEDVIVVTSDLGMKIKARRVNIRHHEIKDSYRVNLKDDRDREIDSLKSKLTKLETAHPNLRVRFENGEGLVLSHISPVQPLTEKEVADAVKTENDQHYFYKRPVEGKPTLGWLLASTGDDQEYEDSWKKYLDKYAEYLGEKSAVEVMKSLCVRINCLLTNDGTAPAHDIEVRLNFPESVIVLSEERFLDLTDVEAPQRPNPKSLRILDIASSLNSIGTVPYYAATSGRKLSKGHWWNVCEDSGLASAHIDGLRNRSSVVMAPLFCIYRGGAAVSSIQIDYLIECGLPEPFGGRLNIKVEREDTTSEDA